MIKITPIANNEVTTINIGSSFFITSIFTLIGCTHAANPTINRILTTLLPRTLARAISPVPAAILWNEIASSGAHVPNAATVNAIIILDIFKFVAIELTASTNLSELFTSTTKHRA